MTIQDLRKAIGEKLFGSDVMEAINVIESFLKPKDKIIDLGAGSCMFTKALKDKGYDVQAVDVKDYNYYKEIKVLVYDGKRLPFKDNEFDTCLLRAVLHHTYDPELVLKEAARVSKKLIIYENVFSNIFQKYYTFAIDSIMNKELIEPHTNKTDKEWRLLFKKLSLKSVKIIDQKAYFFMKDKIYFLNKHE